MTAHGLSPAAVEALADFDLTPEEYGRGLDALSADGRFLGDSCGCIDDRCAGHHHREGEECRCLLVLASEVAEGRC